MIIIIQVMQALGKEELEEDPEKEVASVLCLFPGS